MCEIAVVKLFPVHFCQSADWWIIFILILIPWLLLIVDMLNIFSIIWTCHSVDYLFITLPFKNLEWFIFFLSICKNFWYISIVRLLSAWHEFFYILSFFTLFWYLPSYKSLLFLYNQMFLSFTLSRFLVLRDIFCLLDLHLVAYMFF